MPADLKDDDRFSRLLADLAYYKKAVAAVGVGGQPPTIYAAKYVEDVELLLQIAGLEPTVQTPAVKSQLELSLEHDAAARVERTSRKPKP